MDRPLFLLALCLLLSHQLDAVRLKEWRIFWGLDRMPEPLAEKGFIAVHVPICLTMLWATFFTVPGAINHAVATALSAVFVLHLAVHLYWLRDPRNPFVSAFSWVLIGGAGVAAAADLVVLALA